jgi:23S rRNA (pseudouridine1915-N3)-methyltransferase
MVVIFLVNKYLIFALLFGMKIVILAIGKTNEKYLTDGMHIYFNRLKHYCQIEYDELKDVKPGQSIIETTKSEANAFLSKFKKDDFVILLDEKGAEFDSVQFAGYIQKLQISSFKNVIFLVGGAFGCHETLKKRANFTLSLSKMTFSHQMVRLFLMEQLYRAFTILKNEKYHNP